MISPDTVEQALREEVAKEGRNLDSVDQFLINMTRILGVETTDRFIGTIETEGQAS